MSRKVLCPNCKIGEKTYQLDRREPMCPYMDTYKVKKCPFYRPITKENTPGLMDELLKCLTPKHK